MKFSNYLDSKLIFTDIKGLTVEEVIQEMVRNIAFCEKNVELKKEDIIKSIIKREEEVSTAIGYGIAIPHARIEKFNDFIVSIGILETPFESNIGGTNIKNEVQVVFLIISDILKNKNILKIMSGISKLVRKNKNIANEIRKLKDAKQVLEIIKVQDIEIGNKIVAEDVLSPNIIPATPNSTLEEIAKRFIVEHKSGLPVVDEKGNFLGEITEKELIAFGMPEYFSLMTNLNFLTVGEPFEEYLVNEKTATIKNIYREKKDLIIIDKKTPIMEICLLIVKNGVTRLYVVEDDKYIGLIKRSNIIKKILHI